jgi:hypothetical protein
MPQVVGKGWGDGHREPGAKRTYVKPTVETDSIYETRALGCNMCAIDEDLGPQVQVKTSCDKYEGTY